MPGQYVLAVAIAEPESDEEIVSPGEAAPRLDVVAVGANVLALAPPGFVVIRAAAPPREEECGAAERNRRCQCPDAPASQSGAVPHAFISVDERRVEVTRLPMMLACAAIGVPIGAPPVISRI